MQAESPVEAFFEIFGEYRPIAEIIIKLSFLLGVIGLVRYLIKRSSAVHAHWHHVFEKPEFTPQEFYNQLQQFLSQKEINKAAMSRIVYAEGGVLSQRRDYLRIVYKHIIFDICAAPFGSGFFVSWWEGERVIGWNAYLKSIPIIGLFIRKRNKTFFELDTETVFKDMVSICIKETIGALSTQKGFRMLNDKELESYNRQY